jgi:hypothetical protein
MVALGHMQGKRKRAHEKGLATSGKYFIDEMFREWAPVLAPPLELRAAEPGRGGLERELVVSQDLQDALGSKEGFHLEGRTVSHAIRLTAPTPQNAVVRNAVPFDLVRMEVLHKISPLLLLSKRTLERCFDDVERRKSLQLGSSHVGEWKEFLQVWLPEKYHVPLASVTHVSRVVRQV